MKTKISIALVAALFTAACTKGENAGNGAGQGSTPSGGATSSAVPVPVASVSTTPAEPSAPVASAAPALADAGEAKAKTKDAGAASTKPAKAHVEGKNFALELASPGCRANEDCAMTIKLVAGAGYHVNKEYPYKFLATAAPGVTFLGKGEATTFSKTAGDFHEEGETSATMTVRFKPASPGEAKVSGTYKLSVCSADQCQIEQQPITFAVPVL